MTPSFRLEEGLERIALALETIVQRLDGEMEAPNPGQRTQPSPATACPKCGKPGLRRKNSQTGEEFFGCSGWQKGGEGCDATWPA